MSLTLAPVEQSLEKGFREFIWDRINSIELALLNHSEYVKAMEEQNRMHHALRAIPDHDQLAFELESTANARAAIAIEAAYQQGLKDGLHLATTSHSPTIRVLMQTEAKATD